MVKSTVVDEKTGGSKDSRVRTSSGTFLRTGHEEVVKVIEKRISDFTFIPVENGEGLQVLHYQVGQKYEPHYDYFLDEFNTKNGGQRNLYGSKDYDSSLQKLEDLRLSCNSSLHGFAKSLTMVSSFPVLPRPAVPLYSRSLVCLCW
ncbi:PREDICTED: prolyl 4-hydroxylase 5-like isoform X2 [Camelina sativa]|uniref:Prolyl 4-hydroxylase 5-like isoform X2 n=1 Tax=Camelina sativa TaxID=90675 RepID=A0ABM0YKU2_CAMSA|nr:PREDICTED: prolyl 4-hydroxylase 5-like isoform X2 [Camelina sativa]